MRFFFRKHSNIAFIFILSIVLWPVYSNAQNQKNDSTEHVSFIALSDITFQYDALLNSLEEIQKSAQIPKSIIKIDSNYQDFSLMIDSLSETLLIDSNKTNRTRIESLIKEWGSYKQKVFNWQTEIADHNREVESFKDSIIAKENLWEESLKAAMLKKAPEEILNRINAAIDSTISTKNRLLRIDKNLILAQDKLIGTQTKIDNVLDYLAEQDSKYRGNIFFRESDPIWKWKPGEHSENYWKSISDNFADQKRTLILFIDEYSWQFVFHFLVFLGLIWFLFFLKKRYANADFPGEDMRIKLAKITIQYAATSAVILGFMISIYYYRSAPAVVFSLLTIMVAIPVINLFPKFVKIKSRTFLYLVFAVFLLQKTQDLIIVDHLLNRITELLKAGILIYVMSFALRNQNTKQEGLGNRHWKSIVKYLGPIFLIIAIISIFANLIGAYQLSELLVSGVVNASTYAIIFMVYGVILASVFIVLLRSKYATSLQKFTKDNAKFEKRITGLIYLYMLFLWMRSTLVGFKILNPIIKIYEDFVSLFWIICGVKISVGGILSFLVILMVTFLLARLIREIVNDNVIPVKPSGRGLPNAFSMVIRYMIVTLGVYVALSAAGINLSEFGLIAGALGVGLGFGLQDILHNLVSGLIVSFERPIHVGDTIQVGDLQGVVSDIGVRSSKIRTFDGSEVILPNGDLLSKQVINWTLTDQKRRLEIKIKTSFDANPREVIELLKKEVISHKNVLSEPNPLVLFEGYGESALHFRVLFWVYYNVGLSTKSDVALSIYDKLKEKNIEAPIPQQRLLYLDNPPQKDKPL